MRHASKIGVLLEHANPLISAGLEAALGAREEFELIAAGSNLDLSKVDVAITDCAAGARLIGSGRCSSCRILIITDDVTEITIRRVLEMDIRGYLPLMSSVDSVLRAVRTIHRGGTAIAPVVMTRMAISLRSQPLTGREMDVLNLMVQGLPDKAIARRLQRSLGTAKAHVKTILNKLEASSRTQATAIALRRGLVQLPMHQYDSVIDDCLTNLACYSPHRNLAAGGVDDDGAHCEGPCAVGR